MQDEVKCEAKEEDLELVDDDSNKELLPFERDLAWLIEHLDGLYMIIPEINKMLNKRMKEKTKDLKKSLKMLKGYEKEIESNGEDAVDRQQFSTYSRSFSSSVKEFKLLINQHILLPRSIYVSMVSVYDAFLIRFLRSLFKLCPQILNSSDKTITVSDLMKFGNIDELKNFLIEGDIDSILREEHAKQLDLINKKFSLKMKLDPELQCSLSEVTRLRNLYVHTDEGLYSEEIHNKKDDELKTVRLGVSLNDIDKCYYTLFEICVKMTHYIWRKFYKDDLKWADSSLNEISYNLLCKEKYQLAQKILKFACTETCAFNEQSKMIFIVNYALSHKLDNDDKKCKKILDDYDWSAKMDDFKIAHAVLLENWAKASEVMYSIGNNKDWIQPYQEWPLFYKFRGRDEFLATYKDIYGVDFILDFASSVGTGEKKKKKRKTKVRSLGVE